MYMPFKLLLLLMIRINVNVVDSIFVMAGFCDCEVETSIKTKLGATQEPEV